MDDYQHQQRLIHHIQTLSGVTNNDFNALYVAAIGRFSEYLAIPNQAKSSAELTEVLDGAVLALKKRRGYLLPLGADSESAYREREEWTYAVFTGALFNRVSVTSRFEVAKAILPTSAFAWLHRNQPLFVLWEGYLQGRPNYLGDIIGTGTDKLIMPVTKQTPSVINPSEKPSTAKPVEAIDVSKASTVACDTDDSEKTDVSTLRQPRLPKNVIIQEIDLADLRVGLEKSDVTSSKEALVMTEGVKQPTATVDAAFSLTATAFWQWLQVSIDKQALSVNETDSTIHRVEQGLLLVMPGIIDAFIQAQTKALAIKHQKVPFKQRIELTKALKKHDKLVRNAQGSRIHTYYLGQWADRRLLSGLVVAPEVISTTVLELPMNALLAIDPVAAT